MDALSANVTTLQATSKDIQMFQRNAPTKQYMSYALNSQRAQPPVYAVMQGSAMSVLSNSSLDALKNVPASCSDVPSNKSGVYRIKTLVETPSTFYAYCDLETDAQKWTVILNREDGEINFYRNWMEYKNGFGNVLSEFWIGLEKLREVIKEEAVMDMDLFLFFFRLYRLHHQNFINCTSAWKILMGK